VNASVADADLSDASLVNTTLANASLADADLSDAYIVRDNLTNVDTHLTNLSETKFDCESVRTVTTNFAVNANQFHIVEVNNGSIKEISSCQ
jgi:uncharacterized protein YjbI with pentapeptide repeats